MTSSTTNKDAMLVVSLLISVVSLVLLIGVTWHFRSTLKLLQQQVENDKELLLKLQEQVNLHENTIITHDITKRQQEDECQCKNGTPGPRGPPGLIGKEGHKGDVGLPGPRGDTGDRGPRGEIGPIGYPGEQGDKGDPGPRGLKGEMGHQGIKGEKGSSGLPGITGLIGSKGATGQKGVKGDEGERNGGTVYVRWGHDKCPSTAELVYHGRVGGSDHTQSGGGSNPRCLPLDPNYLSSVGGRTTYRAHMFGTEYQTSTDNYRHIHGRLVPCAVCYVTKRSTVYMLPAKYTCPTGWIREYYGYLMAERFTAYRSQFTCIDVMFKSGGSRSYRGSAVLYFVQGRCESLPCPPYNGRELSCAVCTK